MAQASAVDWTLAAVLYAQGIKPVEIARRVGATPMAVYKRSKRDLWARLASTVKADAVQAVNAVVRESVSPETRQLLESSARTRHALANEILASMDTLSSTKRKRSMREQKERAAVIATLATAAKTTHAWSDGATHTPAVRIGVMNVATSASRQLSSVQSAQSDPVSPVVDVSPPPADDPSAQSPE